METLNKKIAIYARVSKSDKGGEIIQAQLNQLCAYAERRGYEIVQKYVDNGYTGNNLTRPKLDKLRCDIENGEFETILVYDPSRLAREHSHQILLVNEFMEAGIEVLFITNPSAKTVDQKLFIALRDIFTEYEHQRCVERSRLSQKRSHNEAVVTK